MSDRDNLDSEDTVTIYLDTFHDLRRAFFFTVNPARRPAGRHAQRGGVQRRHAVRAAGMDDKTPDFQFDSKGRLTDFGYVVEVRIPFKTLRYPGGRAPQTWGLQVRRIVQRTQYKDTWTDARRAGESFLAQSGAIAGLHDMRARHRDRNAARPRRLGERVARERRRAVRPRQGGPQAGPQLPLLDDEPDRGHDGQPRLQPDRSRRRAGHGEPALRALLSREAALLPRRDRHVRDAEPARLHPADRRSDRRSQADGQARIVERRLPGDEGAGGERRRALQHRARSGGTSDPDSTFGATVTDRSAQGEDNRVVELDTRTIFEKLWYYQLQVAQSWTDNPDGTRNSSPMWMAELDETGRAYGINYKLTGIGTDFQGRRGVHPPQRQRAGELLQPLFLVRREGGAVRDLLGCTTTSAASGATGISDAAARSRAPTRSTSSSAGAAGGRSTRTCSGCSGTSRTTTTSPTS